MRKLVQRGLGVVAASLFVAVGCGDDDDSAPKNTGGVAGFGGQTVTGGTSAKGGAGGTSSGGSKSTGGTPGASGGGAGGASDTTECEVIGELCHAADDGNGPLHECHQLGHSNDPAVCRARFASCVTQCIAAGEGEGQGGAGGGTGVGGAAGAFGAAGAGGKGGEGQSPYCLALGELCHPVAKLSAVLEDCHEVGHIGDAPVCEMRFGECATSCLAARDAGEGTGGGGAGGGGGGGAGGTSAAGAGAVSGGGAGG